MADVVTEKQEPCNLPLNQASFEEYVHERIEDLREICMAHLINKEKFLPDSIETEVYLNLRYLGTDTGIMCSPSKTYSHVKELKYADFQNVFETRYKNEFGFNLERGITIDDVRIRAIGKSKSLQNKLLAKERSSGTIESLHSRMVYFSGKYLETQVYNIEDFMINDSVKGPAVIIDKNSTLLIEPNCTCHLNASGDILITIDEVISVDSLGKSPTDLDTTQLSIFSHRFMSIAEQTGRILQRTAVSTNIKERLDYSCAMFDSNGGLVGERFYVSIKL